MSPIVPDIAGVWRLAAFCVIISDSEQFESNSQKTKMPSPLDSLNPRQREAVCCADGALVLAGAGTGKTRVLTGRIIRLLSEGLAAPAQILAVTFTNKAAREMRGRVETALTTKPSGLELGTFHGVCHRVLRAHANAAGLDKNFQILDSYDQLTLLRRLLREKNLDEKTLPPAEIRQYINVAKERGLRAADMTARNPRAASIAQIYADYEDICRREHKLDFAELILATIDLWRANDGLRAHYARRFRHILVDELQDTSRQQFDWLTMLDSGDNHFFAVGDDDQSIYAFRGAEPDIMRRFQEKLRAGKLIRLEQNYRSGKNILSLANGLISHNRNRLGKTLTTAAPSGDPIAVRAADSDLQEATDVANAIRVALMEDETPEEIAILYRTNAQGRLFERALTENGVNYRVRGGLRFYDRAEVKNAIAYLRLVAGDDRDALTRVINMPARGIGAKSVAALFADGHPFAALQAPPNAKIAVFAALMNELRALGDEKANLSDLTRAAIEKTGLLAHYEKRNEQERMENLRELVNAAAQFEKSTGAAAEAAENPLTAFLATAAIDGDNDEEDGKAISLMTAHAAKGLEFNHVFIVGLEEGLFPHAQSLDMGNDRAVEEERRLLYVAITRARRQLSLHFARQRMLYGQAAYPPASRFLDELPKSCLANVDWKIARADDAERREENGANAPLPPPPLRPPGGLTTISLRPGDFVRHAKYGDGVVLRRAGSGKEARVDITFKKKRLGVKSFKAALAPLEKIS